MKTIKPSKSLTKGQRDAFALALKQFRRKLRENGIKGVKFRVGIHSQGCGKIEIYGFPYDRFLAASVLGKSN